MDHPLIRKKDSVPVDLCTAFPGLGKDTATFDPPIGQPWDTVGKRRGHWLYISQRVNSKGFMRVAENG